METVFLAFPTSRRGSRGPSAHVSTTQSLPPSSHGLLLFPYRNPVLGLRIHLLNPGGSHHEIPNLTVFAEVPLPSKVPVHQARFRAFRCGQPFWGPPFGLPVCCSQLGKEKHVVGRARGWLWPRVGEHTTLPHTPCPELSHVGAGNWSSCVSRRKRRK